MCNLRPEQALHHTCLKKLRGHLSFLLRRQNVQASLLVELRKRMLARACCRRCQWKFENRP